jgi:hypothetical protein
MTKRFGLAYTDPATLDRTPKKSAYWLANKFGTLKKGPGAAAAPAAAVAAAIEKEAAAPAAAP